MAKLDNLHNFFALWFRDKPSIVQELDGLVREILQEERQKAVEEFIEKELKPLQDYCREVNGLPYCKNCGLDVDELTQLQGKDKVKGGEE